MKTSSTTSTDKPYHLDLGAWTRILMAVALIIGAYIWGVMAGMDGGMKGYHTGGHPYKCEKKSRGEEMVDQKKSMPMDHDMISMDPMDMSMEMMGEMLVGKSGDALDRAFIEGMIPHHQGAIDMAKYLSGSSRPELRKLGVDIIRAQSEEIAQMEKWLKEWNLASTGSMNSEEKMMRDHCQMMPEMAGCEKYR